ncbi:glycosyltransferase A (GT-A) superfamily protein (DUF2064 family) [Sporomusaceae bacterium BoRhaA]|uniref:TIGR04282 family arsenosugar biosynthesis glycosyltransferase n=1 Tax=Pelorhabdus rhamnosifermentans TaxID=2772457 RepID=UPI001C05F459|nr:DUF2064 domain-containing protein [Pelorhabdus rhamnosifermentans]MBU2702345.1 glycosyltransferase A (GT-A) superfamily protein (DUF2064 family) [Pelorhabdus rhamnosifermentans]
MRNAVVIFTKVPKEGETKTRLTIDCGGIFTPVEAKKFYEACLLDVVDQCIVSNCGDVYICYNQLGDRSYLKQLIATVSAPEAIKEMFPDQGGCFDAAMQYAADYILRDGRDERLADSIFIVGGDMPGLQSATLQDAVKKLEKLALSQSAFDCVKRCEGSRSNIGAAMVESADQAGGFNIIGYTCTTPFNFEQLFYNMEGATVLDLVVQKAMENAIPLSLLEMVPDIDIPEDLGGFIPIMNTLKLAEHYDSQIVSPKRTIKILQEMGIESAAKVPEN